MYGNFETDNGWERVDNPFDNPDGKRFGPQHVEALFAMNVTQHSGVRVAAPDEHFDTLTGRYQVPFGD